MSKIGTDEVRRIAALAHIGLSNDEVAAMSVELGSIVDFVKTLQAVTVDKVLPTDQVTGLVDVMRSDEVEPSGISQDELLQNVPERMGGYIKVKRVL